MIHMRQKACSFNRKGFLQLKYFECVHLKLHYITMSLKLTLCILRSEWEGLKVVKYGECHGGLGGRHRTSAHMCLHVFAYYDWETDLEFLVDLRTPQAMGPKWLFLWDTQRPGINTHPCFCPYSKMSLCLPIISAPQNPSRGDEEMKNGTCEVRSSPFWLASQGVPLLFKCPVV